MFEIAGLPTSNNTTSLQHQSLWRFGITAISRRKSPRQHRLLLFSYVSDQGPQFITDFTDETSKILGVIWKFPAAGHSQSAEQAEIMNEHVDQRLRPFISHNQDNWSRAWDYDNQKIKLRIEADAMAPKYFGPSQMYYYQATNGHDTCTGCGSRSQVSPKATCRHIRGSACSPRYIFFFLYILHKHSDGVDF